MLRGILTVSLLFGGCKGDADKEPADAAPADAAADAAKDTSDPVPSGSAKKAGPLVIPKAVPALAAGVMALRGSGTLIDAWRQLDPLVGGDKHVEAMITEIDEYIAKRVGVRFAGATQMTGFVLAGTPKFAVIVGGVTGDLTTRGAALGEVEGVSLYGLEGGAAVAAMVDGELIVGQRIAVEASVKAAKGASPALVDAGGDVAELLKNRPGAGGRSLLDQKLLGV